MNVLLVEPDRVLAETMLAAFKNTKHTAVWKRTAQMALDALDNKLPDLIILEIQLGLHNGIEFLYEIRSYPEWQNIPVIVHTLNANALDEQFANAFEELQVLGVFYKPRTSTQQLLKASQQLVSRV